MSRHEVAPEPLPSERLIEVSLAGVGLPVHTCGGIVIEHDDALHGDPAREVLGRPMQIDEIDDLGQLNHQTGTVVRCRTLTALGAALCLASVACAPGTERSQPTGPATTITTTTAPTTTTTTAGTTPAGLNEAGATTNAPSTTMAAPRTTPPGTVVGDPGDRTDTACLDGLTLTERAALLVWPAVYVDAWDLARSTVSDHGVGGVLLMRTRGVTEVELTGMLTELRPLAPLGLIIATDEEGGDVQRLRDLRGLPSQAEVSSSRTIDEARSLIAEHGRFVRSIGVDVVLGPVVDLLPEDGEPPLQRSRFFTGDAETVTRYGAAYIEGWNEAGLGAVLKHFPGHGSATADTHLEPAAISPLDELSGRDLLPYRRLALDGAGGGAEPGRADPDTAPPLAVMVGHLVVPGLTDGRPATLSASAIDHLRNETGFGDALVISDALDMRAIDLDLPGAAVAAVIAGLDVVLIADTRRTGEVIDALVQAVVDRSLTEERLDEAAARVLRHRTDPSRCPP